MSKLAKHHMPFDGVGISQAIYYLYPPLEYQLYQRGEYTTDTTEYVLISTSTACGMETYIFPADRDGKVTDWGELDHSCKDYVSGEEMLKRMGYTLTDHKCSSCGKLLLDGECRECGAPQ